MKKKLAPWLLLSGLVFACPAMSTDSTAPQEAGLQSSAMKVAIDRVTGKQRNLTAAESSALDAQGREMAKARAQARAGNRSARAGGPENLPATFAESLANATTAHGITGLKPTEDMLSSMQATRDASGAVTIQHVDPSDPAATLVGHAEELASE